VTAVEPSARHLVHCGDRLQRRRRGNARLLPSRRRHQSLSASAKGAPWRTSTSRRRNRRSHESPAFQDRPSSAKRFRVECKSGSGRALRALPTLTLERETSNGTLLGRLGSHLGIAGEIVTSSSVAPLEVDHPKEYRRLLNGKSSGEALLEYSRAVGVSSVGGTSDRQRRKRTDEVCLNGHHFGLIDHRPPC
jgi:hypothetical protein